MNMTYECHKKLTHTFWCETMKTNADKKQKTLFHVQHNQNTASQPLLSLESCLKDPNFLLSCSRKAK